MCIKVFIRKLYVYIFMKVIYLYDFHIFKLNNLSYIYS
jgi:hypothetical protein